MRARARGPRDDSDVSARESGAFEIFQTAAIIIDQLTKTRGNRIAPCLQKHSVCRCATPHTDAIRRYLAWMSWLEVFNNLTLLLCI